MHPLANAAKILYFLRHYMRNSIEILQSCALITKRICEEKDAYNEEVKTTFICNHLMPKEETNQRQKESASVVRAATK